MSIERCKSEKVSSQNGRTVQCERDTGHYGWHHNFTSNMSWQDERKIEMPGDSPDNPPVDTPA